MRHVSCAVCGNDNPTVFLQEDQWRVVECQNCRHVYTSPIPDEPEFHQTYSESKNWVKQTGLTTVSGTALRYGAYLHELNRLFPSPGVLVDVGCSVGRFLAQARDQGWDGYGVEPSQDAAAAQTLMGSQRIAKGEYRQILPLQADVVTMFEVLEHIAEPACVPHVIFEQLRPGGYFMGSVPNGDFIRLKTLLRRAFGIRQILVPLSMDPGNHINYFSAHGITALLERSGFTVLYVREAPADYNYLANRFSPILKAMWHIIAVCWRAAAGNLISSNLWFLAQRPQAAKRLANP
jgi:2-polyprenyl-3-methyl-5-hydroxy-6-metoxy-1,4-benzoquinol methylase